MSFSLLYVTCSSHDEAERIARTLLEEKSIACANILGAGTSVYTWKMAFESNIEIYMLLKTRTSLVADLRRRIAELHSYETPCVIEIKPESINRAYSEWMDESIRTLPE